MIDCEVPVQQRDASWAEFNSVINLFAEGKGNWLIIDHKSGSGCFAAYLAQLLACQGLLDQRKGFGLTEFVVRGIDRAVVEVGKAEKLIPKA